MTIVDKLLTKGAVHGRTGELLTPKGIVVHYVANAGSTATANRNYFEGGSDGRYVSSHYIIDLDGTIIRCVPDNERAIHASAANATHIGIECCHPDDTGVFTSKTYTALVELTADTCKRYNIDVTSGVVRHYDVTGKVCPKYYVNNPAAWQAFKEAVTSLIQPQTGISIMGKPTATVGQMRQWAKSKGAKPFFVSLAPAFYKIAVAAGVDPAVAYCQSAKETGYGKFGGVLDESYCNPCGMKTSEGGGDYDPNAHIRFASWELGISAQIDHLALYAGAKGYPKINTLDPRHFGYIAGTAKTVESLSGKWASDTNYGVDLAKMVEGLRKTANTPLAPEDMLKIMVDGSEINTPGYWIARLKDVQYFDGFVEKVFRKYEGA